MSQKISFCLIVKNEAANLRQCVESYKGAFDELVIVDTGSTDDTKKIAAELGARIFDFEWKNDFSAARQFAFDKATGDFLLWADADDRLAPGCAAMIRDVVKQDKAEVYIFTRRVDGFEVALPMLIKRGAARWVRPVHECLEPHPGARLGRVRAIVVDHPKIKDKSFSRNLAMLENSMRTTPMDAFYLASEYYKQGHFDEAIKTADIAIRLGIPAVEMYEMLCLQAICSKDAGEQQRFALSAYNLMPNRREALYLLIQFALKAGQNERALSLARSMIAIDKPKENIWTLQHEKYGWQGVEMFLYCLRKNGKENEARGVEDRLRGGGTPEISLIHATRGRPEQMVKCRDLWMSRASRPASIEHIFVLDMDDAEAIKAAQGYRHELIAPGGGCVAAWNLGAAYSSGKRLVQLSDDWIPPQGWDDIICKRLPDPEKEQVLAVSDGINRGGGQMTKCMCMAIMTRWFYYAQGHMFYPGYKSVFSDNEFTERAYELGAVVEARDIVFQHEHPLSGKAAMDETYRAQNAPERYRDGEALYWQRKNKRAQTGLDRKYAALILAIKDDFCLAETAKRLKSEGVEKVYFGHPDEYWNGQPCDLKDLVAIGNLASEIGGEVVELSVAKHRAPGRHILETEAMVRNELLHKIRGDGYEHVVVADGDELWLPGTLKMLDTYISDNNPESLNISMIPVAGVPGYPIDGARDVAMVYLGPRGKFSHCRSSAGMQRLFPRRQVIHFTATRKTLDEVIQKHRESGHYGDPHYQFEDWIRNTLPKIKPGMKRAHMLTEWDTWPLVREWTRAEWDLLPESVKPFLGEPK